jgi:hypothetical protein
MQTRPGEEVIARIVLKRKQTAGARTGKTVKKGENTAVNLLIFKIIVLKIKG